MTRRLIEAGVPDGPPIMILYELLTYWNPKADNELFPSNETIQFQTGYSRRTIQRSLKRIHQSGILVGTGGGYSHNPNHWRVSTKLKTMIRESSLR